MEPSAGKLRVLCLDGGGIRGLSEILILKELMLNVRMRNKLDFTPEPCQCFDLICGTSTGGLIAILLGRLGKTLDECEKLFREFGSEIFAGGSSGKAARLFLTGSRHASDGLEKVIRSQAAEEMMFEDEAGSKGHVPVAVVSVMKQTGDAELFRTYGVRASVESCSILEACRATSAATTFFPSITINGVEYVDGAFGFNNPSDLILRELKSIEWPAPLLDPLAEIGCLVSVGTGRPTFEREKSFVSSRLTPGGVKSLSDALKCCKEIATSCHRVHLGVAERFKDAGCVNRYYRFDVDRGLESIELNETDDKTMQHVSAVTRAYMKSCAAQDEMVQCSWLLGAKIGTAGEAPIPDKSSPLLLSTLPQSTHSFYGRQTELSEIREALDPGQPGRKCVLLCGIGGSGKTQLALRHIEEQGHRYSAIVWINASTKEHASQSLSEAAVEMASRWPKDLPWTHNRPDASDALKVTSRLRSTVHSKWLLVIDSADDTKINQYVPDCNHGSVMVTSTTVRACRGFSPGPGARIDVGGLDLANSRSLLLKLAEVENQTTAVGEDDSAALKDIVRELSGIPLAIEQAAALIRHGNFSFKKFLSTYKQKYRALMEEPPDEGSWAYDKDRIILTVLDLAYASLETRSKDALLLVFIGIMGSWQIPISVLGRFAFFHPAGTKSVTDEDIAELESLLHDENFLRLALRRLANFFFIRLKGNQQHQSIAIHRIFSQWSLEKVRSLEKEDLLIHTTYGLSREVCKADPEMKSPLRSYLSANQFELKYMAPFKYSLSLLLSQVPQGLFDPQSGRLHDAYCTIIRQAAWAHLGFGNVDEARYYFSQAIEFETVALSNRGLQWPHGRVPLLLLWGLAHAYQRSGDLDGAVDSLQSALRLCESLYPDDAEEAVAIDSRLKGVFERRDILRRHHKNVILAACSTESGASQSKVTEEPAETQLRELSATFVDEEGREEIELDAEEDASGILLGAASAGDDNMVKLLLGLPNIDPDEADDIGRTPLLMAVWCGHTTVVELLLKTDRVNVNSIDPISQHTVLAIAAERGYEAIAQLLLDRDADMEMLSGKEWRLSPLLYASRYGHEAVVRLLLDSGADVNSKSDDGLTSLLFASHKGHEAVVRLLLDRGADVNFKSSKGWTSLLFASQNGHEAVIRLLLDSGANVNSKSNDGSTSLLYASYNGHEEVVRLLLDRGADVNFKDNKGWTSLLFASQNGYEAVIHVLLDSEADVNSRDDEGWTSLLFASQNGHEAVFLLLLDSEADVNSKDDEGWTSLLFASHKGHEAIVRLLLDRRADVNSKDYEGWTSLLIASQNGHEVVVRLLLESGADINSKTKKGSTSLLIASQNGHEAVVRLLLDSGADVNSKTDYGWTSLLSASKNGHKVVVRLLLDGGADVNSKNGDGVTALFIASQNGYEAVVRLLLDSGADVNSKDWEGSIPLLIASENGHEAFVRLLLDRGADVNSKDWEGSTPLLIASENGHEAVIRLLLDSGADVNSKSNDGLTSLLYASYNGHEAVLIHLLNVLRPN
ncbi:hypothetical protein DL764_007239 [Monosporascus ibericus]|uniref:phospholipase A2 n=1 Tax=Monosporascus ibericus TaxID=155417 RepID=A0A4Q4T2T9_9PEZI|nr:hypothetical protein DL764_007239 [Monosporascus ibericus]